MCMQVHPSHGLSPGIKTLSLVHVIQETQRGSGVVQNFKVSGAFPHSSSLVVIRYWFNVQRCVHVTMCVAQSAVRSCFHGNCASLSNLHVIQEQVGSRSSNLDIGVAYHPFAGI